MTVKVGGTYRIGGQSRYPHRVISIDDVKVVTRAVKSNGSLSAKAVHWSRDILEARIVGEV